MGEFTDRMLGRKKVKVIPLNDKIKIITMARTLPQMAMKVEGERVARVGEKFVPAQNNMVDHLQCLTDIYNAAGITTCEEYYTTIMKRLEAVVVAADKARIAALPWYWRAWYWIVKVTGPW